MSLNLKYVTIFSVYLVLINIAGFISMFIDKRLSIKRMWRISEKSLFMFAIFLGSLGSIAGMYTFRHKTKHTSFVIGMPVIFILNCICIYYIYRYLLLK